MRDEMHEHEYTLLDILSVCRECGSIVSSRKGKLTKPIKVVCEECGGSGKIQFLGAEGIPEQDLCPDCKGEGYREVETLGELLSDKPQGG